MCTSSSAENTSQVYDPKEDRWTTLPHIMYHSRMAFPLIPFRGKLYAVGGFDHQASSKNSL
jgi:hypothetical protein